MLIIITKDRKIRQFYTSTRSNSGAWGQVIELNDTYDQERATNALKKALSRLGANEPLCLVGHGNDTEIGGSGKTRDPWGWSYADVAPMLAALPHRPTAVLIEACAEEEEDGTKIDPVFGFAQALAQQLNRHGQAGRMSGCTVYGYINETDSEHSLPNPATIGRSVELIPYVIH
ncbi:hypothetical protein [Hamadaea tsunoensis]|uniref:hypothetical protein n=1 Tax=Hamadaea tsunoensis TaxID=53368 RepID=UPI0003FF866D|nr:hypothetical protein [Hamadaea tsunoensis]